MSKLLTRKAFLDKEIAEDQAKEDTLLMNNNNRLCYLGNPCAKLALVCKSCDDKLYPRCRFCKTTSVTQCVCCKLTYCADCRCSDDRCVTCTTKVDEIPDRMCFCDEDIVPLNLLF